ncbi:type II toxin-antitoxin system VapC family toxin [Parafilimonas sp.]|uniref:type II toxin-antitoxin system VapC family toxin n=1 Tax=Parafilimonas sp. TaxID=1969739 RepID=UPI0039E349E0
MNILLDTHTLIWLFDEPEKLSKKVTAVIKDSNNSRIVSIASLWEAAIKTNLKKLELKLPFDKWELEISLYNFIILDIKFQHLAYYTALPLLHKDPFYRILIAQAVYEELIIATTDEKITKYNVQTIW